MYKLLIGSLLFFVIAGFTSSNFDQDPWKAPASAKSVKNKIPSSKASIKAGKSIYKMRCVACHGPGGKGDGPASKALNPKPADHTSAKTQAQSDGELYWKITNGRGMMVAWEKIIKEEDRWHLVNYIRTLKE